MTEPSGFFTSTFSAPAMVPSSGDTDCAIHSSGRSKLTFLPGSEKVFHAAEVAAVPGDGVAVAPDAVGSADGVPVEDGFPVAVGTEVDEEASGCAVQDGSACPGALHPAARPANTSTAMIRNPYTLVLRVMQPA
jgi:hypothetical protein